LPFGQFFCFSILPKNNFLLAFPAYRQAGIRFAHAEACPTAGEPQKIIFW
jgi:hypothetical protein